MTNLPLSEEPGGFDRARLAEKLRQLAARNVFIGTSSWRYAGWLGQIYTRERYLTRGGFSQKLFTATCLREYAETFPIVCGDFSFYQFPSEQYWRQLFESAPPTLRYAFKAPEEITAKVYPSHPRYGPKAGLVNTSFLDPAQFQDAFLGPLEPWGERIAVLIFEFGAFSKKSYSHAREFLADLDRFLKAIPRRYRYSVEIRNPAFLSPEYFHCLREHGVAHVFNAWTRMPELKHHIRIDDAYTADFSVCRALLRRGRPYEQAVAMFEPYDRMKEENPEGRQAIRALLDHSLKNDRAAFIFVNNRFEGNAPQTIEGIVD